MTHSGETYYLVDDPQDADTSFAFSLKIDLRQDVKNTMPANIFSLGRLAKMHPYNIRPDRPYKEWINYGLKFIVCDSFSDAFMVFIDKFRLVFDYFRTYDPEDLRVGLIIAIYAKKIDTLLAFEIPSEYLKLLADIGSNISISVSEP